MAEMMRRERQYYVKRDTHLGSNPDPSEEGVLGGRMQRRRLLNGEAIILVTIGVLCIIIGALLDRFERTKLEYHAREQAGRIGLEVMQSVSTRINQKAIGLGRLVTAAELIPDLTLIEFQQTAQKIIENLESADNNPGRHNSAIVNISLAPDLVVEHVYPLESNKGFLGIDYREMPEQIADVEAALNVTTPIVSRPFLSVQGPRAIAIRQRIERLNGSVIGIASVAIDLDIFTSQIASQVDRESGYRVGFFVDGFGGFGDYEAFRSDPVVLDLNTRNMDWTIAIQPSDGWQTLPLVTPTRATLLVVSLVLLWLVHVNNRRNRKQRQKERRLEKGIDALSAGFVIFDENDRLIHWNETYKELFGYGSVLKKGVTLQQLLRSGLRNGIFKINEATEEEWISLNVENHRRAGGSVEVEMADGRWIKVLSRRTEDGDLVGIRFDISDLKKAQLEAERLSKAKSEMISVMSHELRTPLTTILGFGRLLALSLPNVGNQDKDIFAKDAINRIVSAGDSLLRLINDMLDYVTIGPAAPIAATASCNLNRVVGEVVEHFQVAVKQRSLNFEINVPDFDVVADPSRLAQIIESLLSNAIKFTPTGGSVHISARKDQRFAFISIADSGPGIPEEKQKTIFEEFSQLAPSGQRRQGGVGLGLARAKRLIEMQGGKISVKSTPGEGSVFTFCLPLKLSTT
jgi:two-component system, cell cycle sensor histidine kinase PleC